jgi:hypothetical protein
MKDVTITVKISIEPLSDGPTKAYSDAELKETVKEAVEEALHYAEGRGFNHGLSDELGLVITGVSA